MPHKFEAGTPNIAGGIAFGAAIDYINSIGIEAIASYENELLDYAEKQLASIEGLKIYGTAKPKTSGSLLMSRVFIPTILGQCMDKLGVAVRTGHHCAQPIMDFYQIPEQ